MDTSQITGLLKSAVDWPFLNEPIWRWLVFIIVLGALLGAWSGVLRHMKSAAAKV